MKLQNIELVFENCETMFINYPDVVYLDIEKPYISFASYMNAICKNQCIEGFSIGIAKGADFPDSTSFSGDMTIDRLKLQDVTQLHITYDDESTDSFYVNWDVDHETRNEKQNLLETNEGNFVYYSYSGDKEPDNLMELKCSVDFLVSMNKVMEERD